MPKKIITVLMLLVAMMAGCARPIDLGPGFEVSSKRFVGAVRWQDFPGAMLFLAPEARDAYAENFRHQKDLHIVDVKYEAVSLNKQENTADTMMLVEYYRMPSVTLKEWRWEQKWQFISGGLSGKGKWEVLTPPPPIP